MKNDLDIYNTQRDFQASIDYVKASSISDTNKKIILDFKDYCIIHNMSLPRIIRYMVVIRRIAESLKVDFDKAAKQDIIRIVIEIQENARYSPWTKITYKKMLKRFYKWLKDTGDDYPEEVKWIKGNIKRSERRLPSNGDLLTEEDIMKLINAATHPRDRALIAALYESGARIGELASLQIENVVFDEHGIILNIMQGKTGARQVRMVSSVSYLATWYQCHPHKNNKKAPFWVNYGSYNNGQQMKYCGISRILKHLFERAGINKRFNPHTFRHSRATFMANHLTEFQMNQYFGWIQGSDMPSTYVHMSGRNIDASILELNGIKQPSVSNESRLKPLICPRCGTINAYDAKFCNNCAGILDGVAAAKLKEEETLRHSIRRSSDDMMNTLMKDPEFVAVFVDKIKALGLSSQIPC